MLLQCSIFRQTWHNLLPQGNQGRPALLFSEMRGRGHRLLNRRPDLASVNRHCCLDMGNYTARAHQKPPEQEQTLKSDVVRRQLFLNTTNSVCTHTDAHSELGRTFLAGHFESNASTPISPVLDESGVASLVGMFNLPPMERLVEIATSYENRRLVEVTCSPVSRGSNIASLSFNVDQRPRQLPEPISDVP